MKLLFAGDLSFDWLPKPPLKALIRGMLQKSELTLRDADEQLRLSMMSRARILAQTDQLFRGLRHVRKDADHFCVNLECALSGRGESLDRKRYTMRALPHYVLALREMGVTLACLANNHVLDYGPEGLADTRHFLELARIQHCGLREKKGDPQSPAILTSGSDRVAVLNYVEPGIIDSDQDQYFSREPTAYPLDSNAPLDIVRKTSQAMPVVVVLHWGPEWSYLESDSQRDFAHALIDSGASAVISHHTHLAGRIEEYKGRLITYGLGNLFLQLPPFSTGRSASRYMIQLEFEGGTYQGYEIVTVGPDSSGMPSSPATYETKSLFEDYLPPAIPKSSPVMFDSLKELPKATVTIVHEGVLVPTTWSNEYLSDRKIVEGKLPIGPGWRAEQGYWMGVAQHRDFLNPEFLSTDLTHMSGDATINCRFELDKPIKRLFVIVGQPELLHRRPKFTCPEMSVQIGERTVFEFNREKLSNGWLVQEIALDSNCDIGMALTVSCKGTEEQYGYLCWRLIGL